MQGRTPFWYYRSMKCPTCSTENKPDAKFCGICGTALSFKEVVGDIRQTRVAFGEAIGLGFKNYFKFSARATRAEYWWFMLFYVLVSLVPVLNWFVWIVFLIPTISLTTRRLHDIGKTGWWQLWYTLIASALWGTASVALFVGFVSAAGMVRIFVLAGVALVAAIASAIWFLVWLARQGDAGPNKYGPDPRTTPRA